MSNAENTRALATVRPAYLAEDEEKLAKTIAPMFPKDCSPEQARTIARIAIAYGLDPLLEELIPYQGRPYLTFDGRIRIADQHEQYDGYDHGPVLGDELKALRPVGDEVVWKCAVYRKDRSRPTVAYGRAGGPQDRNPLSKNDPVTMAQKRAIHRALRAAFPVPIPEVDEPLSRQQLKAIHVYDKEAGVSDEERHQILEATFGVESSKDLTKDQASTYIDGRVVDVNSGEVVDGEYTEAAPEMTWHQFWTWARSQGIGSKTKVAELIGDGVREMSAAEAHAALDAYLVGLDPDELAAITGLDPQLNPTDEELEGGA